MQPQFLFLYPCEVYVSRLLERRSRREVKTAIAELNNLIDRRYRQQGYGINWAVFGQEQSPHVADKSTISSQIRIYQQERILSVGRPLAELRKRYEHPDARQFIRQVPRTDRLVIGGFHYLDCVMKAARAGVDAGIPTFVDADATDAGCEATCRNYQQSVPVREAKVVLASFEELLEKEIRC